MKGLPLPLQVTSLSGKQTAGDTAVTAAQAVTAAPHPAAAPAQFAAQNGSNMFNSNNPFVSDSFQNSGILNRFLEIKSLQTGTNSIVYFTQDLLVWTLDKIRLSLVKDIGEMSRILKHFKACRTTKTTLSCQITLFQVRNQNLLKPNPKDGIRLKTL